MRRAERKNIRPLIKTPSKCTKIYSKSRKTWKSIQSRIATNICRTHPINSEECTILLTFPENGQGLTTAHIQMCIARIMNPSLQPKSEANEFIRENYGPRHLANCCLFQNWWKVSYDQMLGQWAGHSLFVILPLQYGLGAWTAQARSVAC